MGERGEGVRGKVHFYLLANNSILIEGLHSVHVFVLGRRKKERKKEKHYSYY